MSSIVQIQVRRGTASEWSTTNPILAQGEPGYEQDTGKLKFGDGISDWNSLNYFNEGDKDYVFNQAVGSVEWVINHSLNKRPSVTCFDSANTPINGQVRHVDNNLLRIFFNNPVSGKAYLN